MNLSAEEKLKAKKSITSSFSSSGAAGGGGLLKSFHQQHQQHHHPLSPPRKLLPSQGLSPSPAKTSTTTTHTISPHSQKSASIPPKHGPSPQRFRHNTRGTHPLILSPHRTSQSSDGCSHSNGGGDGNDGGVATITIPPFTDIDHMITSGVVTTGVVVTKDTGVTITLTPTRTSSRTPTGSPTPQATTTAPARSGSVRSSPSRQPTTATGTSTSATVTNGASATAGASDTVSNTASTIASVPVNNDDDGVDVTGVNAPVDNTEKTVEVGVSSEEGRGTHSSPLVPPQAPPPTLQEALPHPLPPQPQGSQGPEVEDSKGDSHVDVVQMTASVDEKPEVVDNEPGDHDGKVHDGGEVRSDDIEDDEEDDVDVKALLEASRRARTAHEAAINGTTDKSTNAMTSSSTPTLLIPSVATTTATTTTAMTATTAAVAVTGTLPAGTTTTAAGLLSGLSASVRTLDTIPKQINTHTTTTAIATTTISTKKKGKKGALAKSGMSGLNPPPLGSTNPTQTIIGASKAALTVTEALLKGNIHSPYRIPTDTPFHVYSNTSFHIFIDSYIIHSSIPPCPDEPN